MRSRNAVQTLALVLVHLTSSDIAPCGGLSMPARRLGLHLCLCRLRGGMPLPHYVPFGRAQGEAEEDEGDAMHERVSASEMAERVDEIKRRYPIAALAMAINGSTLENHPLCVTAEDFHRLGVDPTVPQILPLGGANHSQIKLLRGQEVTDMVLREAAERADSTGPVNMSDPDVQLVHQLEGYRPEGNPRIISPDNVTSEMGGRLDEEWLYSMSDARRNRTYMDDWNHYFELIEQAKLSSETDGIGLEDYYEYMQVLNKELLEAAEYGNVSGIQRLVEMGADVNYAEIDPDFAYTPLIMAATTGEIRAMSLLLRLGASVHDTSVYNGTALHYAASNGKVEACNMLLQHGADPSAFAEWGGTPMEWALERLALPGAREVIELLEPITDEEAQLGRHHPRPWLGPREEQGWFWEMVKTSGVKLAEHGWWGRNQHRYPSERAAPEQLGYWERRAAAQQAEVEGLAQARRAPREPEDPLLPSRPTADEGLLVGTPGRAGLRIGEYVDGSGGLDLALLDDSWQRTAWRFEEHEAYRRSEKKQSKVNRRTRKLME